MKTTLRFTWSCIKNIAHRLAALLTTFIVLTSANAQTNVWTWVSGDSTLGKAGVYGTKGVPDAANKPGSRDQASSWKDASGNLWLFGGWDDNSHFFNDIWMYNITTGLWTWVGGDNGFSPSSSVNYGTKGVAAASNMPGGRFGQTAWTDASGNIWIFGGLGYDASGVQGFLNDLWMFNSSTQQWTWVSGDETVNGSGGQYGIQGIAAATNMPGGRSGQTTWTDASGNFWIFGGLGYDIGGIPGALNDLWKYNPSTNQWTWVSGENTINNVNSAATQGTPDAGNLPGSRMQATGWIDASGNFWIFGGGAQTTDDYYNDLWKYDPGTGLWTWVSGDISTNNTGVYGTRGLAATTNKPGGHQGLSEMTDANGNFWFFGGVGYGASGAAGLQNDLWFFSPSSGKWAWVSGDQTPGNAGVYGIKGVGAATNKPGGREYQNGWIDGAGNIWIFAGLGTTGYKDLNDLWKFSTINALPLRDISLQGTHHDNENQLLWQTMDELNTVRFRIERSSNGKDFTVIGTVAAAGTGNNRYSFTDAHADGASFYYRIKTEDLDGNAGYSRDILLQGVTGKSSISVYPNPAGTDLVLQTTDNSLLNTFVKLYDASGRFVKELRITSLQQHIDLHNLPNGVVWLQFSNDKVLTVVKE